MCCHRCLNSQTCLENKTYNLNRDGAINCCGGCYLYELCYGCKYGEGYGGIIKARNGGHEPPEIITFESWCNNTSHGFLTKERALKIMENIKHDEPIKQQGELFGLAEVSFGEKNDGKPSSNIEVITEPKEIFSGKLAEISFGKRENDE